MKNKQKIEPFVHAEEGPKESRKIKTQIRNEMSEICQITVCHLRKCSTCTNTHKREMYEMRP